MNKSIRFYHLILLFVSPFVFLIFSVIENKLSKTIIFTIFGAIYGFLMVIQDGNDSSRHIENVSHYTELGLTSFLQILIKILVFTKTDGFPKDIYAHIMYWTTGYLFKSKYLLFLFGGAIFGFFYGWSIEKIYKTVKISSHLILIILTVILITHRSFENIQTLRSWTGMWYLCSSTLFFVFTTKKKAIIMIFLSTFFHLMFGLILVPILIGIFIKRINYFILVSLYISSFFISFQSEILSKIVDDNEVVQEKIQMYSAKNVGGVMVDKLEDRKNKSSVAWYTKFGKTDSVYLVTNLFIILLLAILRLQPLFISKETHQIIVIGIFIAIFANYMDFSFAFYSRTMATASTFIYIGSIFLWNEVFKSKNKKLKLISRVKVGYYLASILIIPKIILSISAFLTLMSFYVFFTPILYFVTDNISVMSVIKLFI